VSKWDRLTPALIPGGDFVRRAASAGITKIRQGFPGSDAINAI